MTSSNLDITAIRNQFPIISATVHGKQLVYFDNAATSQKPQSVIDAITNYYTQTNANIHRGAHYLAAKATQEYEDTRKTVAEFIGAASPTEIIFTSGTTEGINLVASCMESEISEGDEILITGMEHHSNIVPWQMLCEKTGAQLKVAQVTDNGEIDIKSLKSALSERTKIVAFTHVSNALGTINPATEICKLAKSVGAMTVVDGAQAVPHMKVNVQEIGCDFYAFSAHKMYGPTGVGALYCRSELLEKLPPYKGGGEMIHTVTFEKTTYNKVPHKFEAGTPNIAGVIGMKAAIEFIQSIGYEEIANYENQLLAYATEKLSQIEGLKIVGQAKEKASVISFVIDGAHAYDLGTLLDQQGIAVRTGHHCCEPLMNKLGIPGTIRASFAIYNTAEEIDNFIAALERSKALLS